MRIASGMLPGNAMPHIGMRRPGFGSTATMPGNIDEQLNSMILNSARFVANAGPRATSLSNTLANLSSVLGRTTANSENNNVLRVLSFTGSTVPETSVLVEQIAQAQRNEGASLRSDDRIMPSGSYSFEIEIGGKTHEISFTASAGMTNRDFMQRMADAVNKADIGVSAAISSSNNHSSLNFTSKATGANQVFSVNDVNGNAVEAMGVAKITQNAQDAVFSVNGGEKQTSASNDIDLGGGLRVTLVDSSSQPVRISSGRDAAGMQASMRQVVSGLNSLLEAARSNDSDLNTRRLVRDLEGLIRRNRRALENIGISMTRNGTLAIDEAKLKTSAEDGSLHSFLSGSGPRQSGFVNDLNRIAESVSSNPLRHISRHVVRTPGFDSILSAVSSPSQSAASQAAAANPNDFIPQDLLNFLMNMLG